MVKLLRSLLGFGLFDLSYSSKSKILSHGSLLDEFSEGPRLPNILIVLGGICVWSAIFYFLYGHFAAQGPQVIEEAWRKNAAGQLEYNITKVFKDSDWHSFDFPDDMGEDGKFYFSWIGKTPVYLKARASRLTCSPQVRSPREVQPYENIEQKFPQYNLVRIIGITGEQKIRLTGHFLPTLKQ